MARLLGLIPATYPMMAKSLDMGLTLIVVPGGVPEVLQRESTPATDGYTWRKLISSVLACPCFVHQIVLMEQSQDIFIQKRWGFIKLAHEFQVPLIPVFTENELDTFSMIKMPLFRWRVWLAYKTNLPTVLPLMKGWKYTPLPNPVPLKLHVGEAIYPSTPGKIRVNGALLTLIR
jgi:hypothetical protein